MIMMKKYIAGILILVVGCLHLQAQEDAESWEAALRKNYVQGVRYTIKRLAFTG